MKNTYLHVTRGYLVAAVTASMLLILSAAYLLYGKQYVPAASEAAVALLMLTFLTVLEYRRRRTLSRHIKQILAGDGKISESLLMTIPLPMAVCSIDGTVGWHNELFGEIYGNINVAEIAAGELIPEIKWSDVLKYPNGKSVTTHSDGKSYSVTWRMLKYMPEQGKQGDHYSVFLYMDDITREKELEDAYDNERVDVAVINVDNFDDMAQKSNDDVVDNTASKVRCAVAKWARDGHAVLKKTDRDRFFAVFEHQRLKEFIAGNFDVIENVRKIAEEIRFPLSLSIGIGTGEGLTENEASARNALDLALGRGGGQVCVKDAAQFKFYGGKTGEYERSTRVKARAVASALNDFIANSDNVIFMGHRAPDYDCFGAAIGLQRAVRCAGKRPYIVVDRSAPAIETMYDMVKRIPEYLGMFANEEDILDRVTENTLLVVLDTHRPSMLPCGELLKRVSKIVLIDHHRRSTEFISPCSLIYHEPYASSTCEMATEIIEYMGIGTTVLKEEAYCLYTGILMDTKHFMLKTGVRTFEAASYLRKLGLNTVAVRRMFCSSREEYMIKSEIVNGSVMIRGRVAVSKTNRKYDKMRVVASIAADDLLNIENVTASVVVYPSDGGVGFCARSLGEINVQLVMEKLGGGGHMTVSGAYIKGISVDEGVRRAEAAVCSYLDESHT